MGRKNNTQKMADEKINPLLSDIEKLSLLPDRMYIIIKPEEGTVGFSTVAYDTTDPNKQIHPSFFVLRGLMEMMDTDMDRLVSLGQMSVMDRMVELESKGERVTSEDLGLGNIEKINMGRKH